MGEQKSFAEYMMEFAPSEIYEGLMRGLFPEKLPPIFTVEKYLDYEKRHAPHGFSVNKIWRTFVLYENMRSLNRPRQMGIADPIGYSQLCHCLEEHWGKIQDYFNEVTKNQEYKVSRVHVRKMDGTDLIFKMNYHPRAWNQDPVPDIRIGAHYLVRADISNCFPSIYTHSLPWALVGKDVAKEHTGKIYENEWYNQIDRCAQCIRNGETTGLLIGNHASNILSEIVLSRIDERLCSNASKYRYVRYIDDFECYADTRDHAEAFLVDLKDALSAYNLKINYSKTSIIELPTEYDSSWVGKINEKLSLLPTGILPRKNIESFLASVVRIMKEENDAAVALYALKALSKRVMFDDARIYYVKYIAHLAAIFPYLYAAFDKYIFDAFDVSISAIADIAQRMLDHCLQVRNFEEGSYAFYFAYKYGFEVNFHVDGIIKSHDAVLCLCCYLYARRLGLVDIENAIKSYAASIVCDETSFGEQWIFLFEVLDEHKLPVPWQQIKSEHVSFLKSVEEVQPVCTPDREAVRIDWDVEIAIDGGADDPVCKILHDFETELPAHFDKNAALKYCNRILANIWGQSLVRKNVAIPKDRSKYYDGEINDLGVPDISIALLRHVLKWLRANRYVGERVGRRGVDVSCYWAKKKLLSIFAEISTSRLITTDRDFEEVVLKDENKRIITDVPLTGQIDERRNRIRLVNQLYAQHKFMCVLDKREKRDVFYPRLKAVFNNSSWELGGRLFASGSQNGVDYQCMPSDMRPTITIDDAKTVELDYSGLHVNMLYALEGVNIHGVDPYDFLSANQRSLAKFVLLVVLNARDEEQAYHAIQNRCEELRFATGLSPKKEKLRRAFLSCTDIASVIEKAKARHPKLVKYFFSQFALRLQNLDSKIALDVVGHFAEMGVPVLPVHDSFIIDDAHKTELHDKMDGAYSDALGFEFVCAIKEVRI